MQTSSFEDVSHNFEDEISFLDILITLGEAKKTITFFVGAAAFIAMLVNFLITPIYTARTLVLLPPQQHSIATAFANLGGMAAIGGTIGVKTPEEMYVAFFKSARVADVLIDRFDLKKHFQVSTQSKARNALSNITKVTADKKSGLITLEINHADPLISAELANAYVSAMQNLLSTLAVTEAQQRRLFLEGRLALVKSQLIAAEVALREMQSKSGLLSIDSITQGAMRSAVDLRAQIAQREVQLGVLRSFATLENADVLRLSAELAGLREQLSKLEQGQQGLSSSTGKGLEAVRAYRELKYQEAVMDALVRQYEITKVDEAREGPLLQQVDIAVPPEQPSYPNQSLVFIFLTTVGALLGILFFLVRRYISMERNNNQKIQAFKRAWAWR